MKKQFDQYARARRDTAVLCPYEGFAALGHSWFEMPFKTAAVRAVRSALAFFGIPS